MAINNRIIDEICTVHDTARGFYGNELFAKTCPYMNDILDYELEIGLLPYCVNMDYGKDNNVGSYASTCPNFRGLEFIKGKFCVKCAHD